MFTTYNNRQIERQLDREEEEVGTGLCLQLRLIYRYKDSKIERRRRQVQEDVNNLKQQIDREIVRQRRGGRNRFMYKKYNNRQRQLGREEQEEVGTAFGLQYTTIVRQRDSQIERKKRQVQVDVYNLKQQIDREIVKQI